MCGLYKQSQPSRSKTLEWSLHDQEEFFLMKKQRSIKKYVMQMFLHNLTLDYEQ